MDADREFGGENSGRGASLFAVSRWGTLTLNIPQFQRLRHQLSQTPGQLQRAISSSAAQIRPRKAASIVYLIVKIAAPAVLLGDINQPALGQNPNAPLRHGAGTEQPREGFISQPNAVPRRAARAILHNKHSWAVGYRGKHISLLLPDKLSERG